MLDVMSRARDVDKVQQSIGGSEMLRSNRSLVLALIGVLIIAGLPLSAPSQEASKAGPAKVEPIPGTDLKRVVLTEKAAERLGIETAPVRDAQGSRKPVGGGGGGALAGGAGDGRRPRPA